MEAIFKICKLATFPKVEFYRIFFGVTWELYNSFKTKNCCYSKCPGHRHFLLAYQSTTIKTAAFNALSQQQSRQLHSMHSVNNNQGSCIQCTQSTTIKTAASNALSQQQSRQLHSKHSVNNYQDSCIQCTQSTTIKTAAFNALGQQQSSSCIQ